MKGSTADLVRAGNAALGSGGPTKWAQVLPGRLASNSIGCSKAAGGKCRGSPSSQLPSDDLKLMGAMCSPRARLLGEPGAGEGRLPPATGYESATPAQRWAVVRGSQVSHTAMEMSSIGSTCGILNPF